MVISPVSGVNEAPATARIVRLSEPASGLDARCQLLDSLAPVHAALLWDLAGLEQSHNAIHAMWTGPEISVPINGGTVLPAVDLGIIKPENATSHPKAGDIALVCAPHGTWSDGPPFDLVDVGLFYGHGGRLLMPMGWIMASVCARILDEDLAAVTEACGRIRRNGACAIRISR